MSTGRSTLADRLAPCLALGLCVASAFWIANGVAPWDGERTNVWHHYEYLAEGFLRGHTYLPVDPDPHLLKLKDPYVPAENARYRLWDASLFQGRYYLYYGPAPAVVLMVPWRVLTGHMLPQRMAVAIFASAGITGLALLLWELRRKCFPGLSGPALGLILVVGYHAAWLPVILRRPGVWELPIVSAGACLWWSILFLYKFRASEGRIRWAVATGAALALMIGCRVTNLFEAGLVVLLLLVPFSGEGGVRAVRWKAALAAAGLLGAGGLALLIYNKARFGSWLEFGQSFMLGGTDFRRIPLFKLSRVPFNVWAYLTSLPEVGPYFPFLHGTWSDTFPPGFLGYEAMYGAIFTMPVQLLGIGGLVWAWRRRGGHASARAGAIAVAAAACSSALAAAILFCWLGAYSRYIAELVAGWTVVTSVGMMAVFGSDGARRPGRAARTAAAAAACWTVGCVWLASAEFRGFMKRTNPGTYDAVAHALDYPSQWWIQLHGMEFSPVEIEVRIPPASPPGETVLMASGYPEKVNQLLVDRLDAGHAQLILSGNEDSVLETPPLDVPSGRLRVRLSAPWLYPPPEHPYWDRFGGSSRRHELQTLFSLDWGLGAASAHSAHVFDASGFVPAVRGDGGGAPGSPYVESLRPAAPAPGQTR